MEQQPPTAASVPATAARIRTVVPDLVGMSLAVLDDGGVVLTLAASDEQAAVLDALQYLDGGPCVEDVERAEMLEVDMRTLLGSDRWQLYARLGAALGVGSSLSIPVTSADRVMGGVNLYARSGDAFSGLHEEIAEALGSDAELAIADADLSFWTAKTAMDAPARVREGGDLNTALGIISAGQGVNIPIARQRLRNAAARAGITEGQAAGALSKLRTR